MRKIYFICVNYDNTEFTIKYIQSVYSLINKNYFTISVVIVDNNSKLSEYNKLTDFLSVYPEIKLVRNEINVGYFRGLNSGINNINLAETSFLIIGNNDIEFDKDFLHELYFMEGIKKKIYVLAPNIINLDGDHQNPVSVNRLSYFRRLWLDIYHLNYYIGIPLYFLIEKFRKKTNQSSKNQLENRIPITIAYGSCYILTQFFFLAFTKLDDRVFLYGEEALLSNQVRSAGGIILYCPNLIVHHAEHRSINKIEPKTLYKAKKEAYKQYKEYL